MKSKNIVKGKKEKEKNVKCLKFNFFVQAYDVGRRERSKQTKKTAIYRVHHFTLS